MQLDSWAALQSHWRRVPEWDDVPGESLVYEFHLNQLPRPGPAAGCRQAQTRATCVLRPGSAKDSTKVPAAAQAIPNGSQGISPRSLRDHQGISEGIRQGS